MKARRIWIQFSLKKDGLICLPTRRIFNVQCVLGFLINRTDSLGYWGLGFLGCGLDGVDFHSRRAASFRDVRGPALPAPVWEGEMAPSGWGPDLP